MAYVSCLSVLAACFILGISASTQIYETKPDVSYARVIWLLKDWRNFASINLWTEDIVHENLRFRFNWDTVYSPDELYILVRNSENSGHDPVYWRINYDYLYENGTINSAASSGQTSDYTKGFMTTTTKHKNHLWKRSFSKLKAAIPESQKDLGIQFDIWYVRNINSTMKPSAEYLIQSAGCQTFQEFGFNLVNDEETSDVIVTLPGGILNLHRNMIKQRAPELYAQHFSNVEDKLRGKYLVVLTDISFDVFDRIIKFIYTDQTPDLYSTEEWKNLCLAAKRFKVKALEDISIQKITNSIEVNNAVKWFEFSKCNGISKLEDYIREFWRMNAITMGSENWEQTLTNQTTVQCV